MIALGLMSGTSADGVTAALVELKKSRFSVLKCRTTPYPASTRRLVLGASTLAAPALSRLNMELGEIFARAALKAMRGSPRPRVIGSHGQTIWHGPEARPRNTFQIGEPSVIAETTGIPVVADFRPRDMAAGGQGAPLMPAFDEFLFARGPLRALQNIGGIANVSVVGKGRLWAAFDTGPGNCLMDLAARLATSGKLAMDKDGRLAARGKADLAKLRRLLQDPFFRRPPPKSLDRGAFAEPLLRRHFGRPSRRALPDVLATLNLFTARSIFDSYQRFLPSRRLSEIIVSGGGAKNPVLMRNLRQLFAPTPVVLSNRHGIDVMAKEAACFAWMACRAIAGQTNNCPQATGARGRRILGKIIPI